MGEKDLWLKLGLIVVIVGLSITFIYPPEEKLKPGIDLGGGHSLLFEIDDTGDTGQRGDLAERVMDILKQRVDPGGTRNLVWRPIGRNRLEIQMPQPPKGQREARLEYEKARQALADTNITRAQILNALELPGDQRQAALDAIVGAVPSRRDPLNRLVHAHDDYKELIAAQGRPAETQPADTQPSATQPADVSPEMARQMDKLFQERNKAIEDLLATNLDVRIVGDLLQLDPASDVRKTRLAQLRKDHADLVPRIDNMAEKYKSWAAGKGFLDDPSDLMRLLRGAGKLEFRILATEDTGTGMTNDPVYREPIKTYREQIAQYGPRPQEGDNFQWFEIANPDENNIAEAGSRYILAEYLGTKYVLSHATKDKGLIADPNDPWKLRRATVGRDKSGALAVDFELDPRGGDKFGIMTANNIDRPLCIFLDDKAISSAIIRSQINTNGQISGRFTQDEVLYLVNTLEAGVLPARLKEVPLQEKSVGPSLGETNRRKGTYATAIAFLLTVLFMAVYYGYSGFIADIALLLNLVITVGIMAFLGNTFTLPGIAGLILTLGMAVDANVLIYERIREELQRGVSVKLAVKLGYEKAFSAILDSNVTTIITAVILASLGSEEIKGFGQTLGLGLCISMFTALFVTRQYFYIMVPNNLDSKEVRKTWIGTGALALVGGAIFGLGWLWNSTPETRDESALLGLGQFVLIVFAVALVLLLTLWAFRLVYRVTGHQRANRLPMMKALSTVNIDWMAKHRIFWTISAVVVGSGVLFSYKELAFDAKSILDIEFLGGTSVQVQLNEQNQGKTDEQIAAYIKSDQPDGGVSSISWLGRAADQIEQAEVTPVSEYRFRIATPEPFTQTQMEALLLPLFEDHLVRSGIQSADRGVNVQFDSSKDGAERFADATGVKELLKASATYLRTAADRLRDPRVQLVREETEDGKTRNAFEIITTETSKQLVAEAILASMRDILEVTHPIDARLYQDPVRAPDGLFPVKQGDNVLADVLGGENAGAAAQESVATFKSGVLVVFQIVGDAEGQAPTAGQVQQRIREMQLQPDFEGVSREFQVIGLDPVPATVGSGDPRFTRFAVVSADRNFPYVEGAGANEKWRGQLAESTRDLAEAALASSRSLQRVTQFAPQVAEEAAKRAVIAIILSMIAIAAYLWVRFGSADFGVAGIIALYHDVAITLSAVIVCHFVHDTAIGRLLLLQDFKIDLTMIAALLTIVGFSINDTIVIFDRIRENRGRLGTVSSALINRSLNETLSRTIITTGTVLITVVVMYAAGGTGIHGFAFAMLVGCLSGTYSTLAVATPLLQSPRTLWSVAIVLVSLTFLGLCLAIDTKWLQIVVALLVVAATVAALLKALASTTPHRREVPAA